MALRTYFSPSTPYPRDVIMDDIQHETRHIYLSTSRHPCLCHGSGGLRWSNCNNRICPPDPSQLPDHVQITTPTPPADTGLRLLTTKYTTDNKLSEDNSNENTLLIHDNRLRLRLPGSLRLRRRVRNHCHKGKLPVPDSRLQREGSALPHSYIEGSLHLTTSITVLRDQSGSPPEHLIHLPERPNWRVYLCGKHKA